MPRCDRRQAPSGRGAGEAEPGPAVRSTDMISNRRARKILRRQLEASINAGAPSACLTFGADNLGELNQTYGFDVADTVLSEIAARIRATVAREIGTAATVRHLSGSKFGVVASGLDDVGAKRTAIQAQDAVATAPIHTVHGGVAATISAGVATLGPLSATGNASVRVRADEMMACAIDMLTDARRTGPTGLRATRVSEASNVEQNERKRIAIKVMHALETDSVGLAYQPIVSSTSRRPAFHECLARLFEPGGSVMPAGVFVPVIERLGQVRLLDRRMLGAVFDALEDAPRARLSLNVSPQTLRDREWMSLYNLRAANAPRAAERLIVEITESSASGDAAAAANFMAEVRARGAAFALDDFGAGYTSLRQLRDFRFDLLKIDGTFASDIAANPDNRIFVNAIVQIAQHFDMATVAEFVETEAEAKALAALNVTYQQGYLHGAPSMDLMGVASNESAAGHALTA